MSIKSNNVTNISEYLCNEGDDRNRIGSNDDEVIYLTEDGFSEPVGEFNKCTRIAKLTRSIVNKTLAIEISDVCLEGNDKRISNDVNIGIDISDNLTDIEIKNLTIESKGMNSSSGIALSDFCSCVTIKSCMFRDNNIAIGIDSCRNINIINCTIENANFGVVYNTSCLGGKVEKNKIYDSGYGVFVNELNTEITIENNKIVNRDITRIPYGVSINVSNSNIKIISNKMVFTEMRTEHLTLTQVELFGIYFEENGNAKITMIKNEISFINNEIVYPSQDFELLLYPISLVNPVNDSVVEKNKLLIQNNIFDLASDSDQQALVLNSLVVNGSSGIKISGNQNSIEKNVFRLSKSGGSRLELINMNIFSDNNGIKVWDNNNIIDNNRIYDFNNENNTFEIYNMYFDVGNSNINIQDNRFKLYIHRDISNISIFINEMNDNINIIKNVFSKDMDGCVWLNKNNRIMNISQNSITHADESIVLMEQNDLIRIVNNRFVKCKIAIKFIKNNLSNSICKNTISESGIAIIFTGELNTSNEIVQNKFINNKENLIGIDRLSNYVVEKKC